MSIAFGLTSDSHELQELLDVSARSLFEFVDATTAGIADQVRVERDELTRGTHAERLEAVALILDGAPISRQRAEARLGYRLEQSHTAAVVWSDDAESSQLERATEALVRTTDTHHPLSVVASAATRWVWIPGKAAPDVRHLEEATNEMPRVRVAIGSTARGIEGFRRSHLDAITTQRMLARLNSAQRVARFETVQLVSLVTQDTDRADQFVKQTLGKLETASPELRAAVLTFVNEQCNASLRRRDSTPTEIPCCAVFPGQSSFCHDRSSRTVCASPSRWRWCTGAEAATPEESTAIAKVYPVGSRRYHHRDDELLDHRPFVGLVAAREHQQRGHHAHQPAAPCVRRPRDRRAPSRSGTPR